MTDIMAEAVEAIEKKLDGSLFDGSAKFAIQDEGSIIIDSSKMSLQEVFSFTEDLIKKEFK